MPIGVSRGLMKPPLKQLYSGKNPKFGAEFLGWSVIHRIFEVLKSAQMFWEKFQANEFFDGQICQFTFAIIYVCYPSFAPSFEKKFKCRLYFGSMALRTKRNHITSQVYFPSFQNKGRVCLGAHHPCNRLRQRPGQPTKCCSGHCDCLDLGR